MKNIKTIGTISAILVIINYIGIALSELLLSETWLVTLMDEVIIRLIFTIGIVGFYFAVIQYLNRYGYQAISRLITILIIVETGAFVFRIIEYYYDLLPGLILTIIYISVIVLFIVFGIKILNIKNDQMLNLKQLKYFVKAMFVTFGIVFLMAIILKTNNQIELMNSVYSIYAIPYIFGLIFFIKLDIEN